MDPVVDAGDNFAFNKAAVDNRRSNLRGSNSVDKDVIDFSVGKLDSFDGLIDNSSVRSVAVWWIPVTHPVGLLVGHSSMGIFSVTVGRNDGVVVGQ